MTHSRWSGEKRKLTAARSQKISDARRPPVRPFHPGKYAVTKRPQHMSLNRGKRSARAITLPSVSLSDE